MNDSPRLRGSGDYSPLPSTHLSVPPCPRCAAPGYGFPRFHQLTLENMYAEWRTSRAPRRPPSSSLSSTAPTQALATPQVRGRAGPGRDPARGAPHCSQGSSSLFSNIRARGGALGQLWGCEGTEGEGLAYPGPHSEVTVSDFVRKQQSGLN